MKIVLSDPSSSCFLVNVLWWLKRLKHNIPTSSSQQGNDSINTQCGTNRLHLTSVPKAHIFTVLCVAMFRRPEGKFKKKQNPRDEALQILRPQMDNPPAPQVDAHIQILPCRLFWLYAFAQRASKCLCLSSPNVLPSLHHCPLQWRRQNLHPQKVLRREHLNAPCPFLPQVLTPNHHFCLCNTKEPVSAQIYFIITLLNV